MWSSTWGRAQLGLSETNPRINSGTQYFNPRTATRMDGAVQLEIRLDCCKYWHSKGEFNPFLIL